MDRWQPGAASALSSLNASRVAVSGLLVEDFTGDGHLDVVAIGSSTGNVVLFQNEGR